MQNGPPAFEKVPETPVEKLRFALEQHIDALSTGLRAIGARLDLARAQVEKLRLHEQRLELQRRAMQAVVAALSLDVNPGWVAQEIYGVEENLGNFTGEVPL